MHDELKYDRHSDIFQNLSRETITFRNNTSQTALPMRELGSFKPGEMVGGTAAHWGGNARRFLPHDFELRSQITERYGKGFFPEDCTAQDWGVTWDEIEPYYDQFEHIYGVGGKAGNLNGEIQPGGNPHEGPRSREYPNPPTQRTPQGEIFAKAVSELGYAPFQGPAAGMTQDYSNLYKVMLLECHRGGFCSSHVCSQGAKANPLTAVLPALYKQKTFELRPLCNVIKVNTDSTGKQATGVTYIDARGREVEQPAEHRGAGDVLLQQHAPAAALRHRQAVRSADRPRRRGPQLFVPDRRPGARLLRRSRVQPVHRRRHGEHVDRRAQRRRDRSLEARLRRRRLYQRPERRAPRRSRASRCRTERRAGARSGRRRSRTTTGARSASTSTAPA